MDLHWTVQYKFFQIVNSYKSKICNKKSPGTSIGDAIISYFFVFNVQQNAYSLSNLAVWN